MSRPVLGASSCLMDWEDQNLGFSGDLEEGYVALISAVRFGVEWTSPTAASLESQALADAFADLLDIEWAALFESVAASVSGLELVLLQDQGSGCGELRSQLVPSISSQVTKMHPRNAPPEHPLLWE